MASVGARRNKSGGVVFRVQFRIGNSAKQETFPTEKAANKFKELVDRIGGEAAREILERRRNNTGNTPTLREWTERYLDPDAGILTGIQPGTRHDYKRIAEAWIFPVLGDYPLDAITKADVGKWIAWQEKQPSGRGGGLLAAKTVENHHALLSNLFKAANAHGVMTGNPAHAARISEGTSREGVFLSLTEYAAILEQIPEFYRPLVAFLAGTGARWSEATAVTEGDVSRDADPVLVRLNKAWKKPGAGGGGHVIGVTKTKAGRRSVSLWPEVVAVLPHRDDPNALLFQGKQNHARLWYGPFNTRIWNPAVTKSGVGKDVNIHDLRHTHASWLIANGAPLPYIQRRLGHEDIRTTINLYGHLLPAAQKEVADIMQHLFADLPAMGGRTQPLSLKPSVVEDED